MRIKMGAKFLNNTFKIRIGDYSMAKAKIETDYGGSKKFLGSTIDNSSASTFSTYLTSASNSKDTVYIDVAESISKKEISEIVLFDFFVVRDYELLEDSYAASIFLRTSIDKNDQWLLLLSNSGGYVFSAEETILTNGTDKIQFKALESEKRDSFTKSPARGIELYLNDQVLAAFQYKSVGMGYKQYLWIADQATQQQEMIITGSVAAMLELFEGARVHRFDE